MRVKFAMVFYPNSHSRFTVNVITQFATVFPSQIFKIEFGTVFPVANLARYMQRPSPSKKAAATVEPLLNVTFRAYQHVYLQAFYFSTVNFPTFTVHFILSVYLCACVYMLFIYVCVYIYSFVFIYIFNFFLCICVYMSEHVSLFEHVLLII